MARRVGLALLGALGFLLVCELALRALPVSTSTQTGYYIDPLVMTNPPGHEWVAATGWDLRNAQTLRSNNAGFAAERDFHPDPAAVALVGDSYVESSMLPAPQRPQAQLERALGGSRPVYAMGSPGTALLDYAERIRLASERWGVRDFVVVMESGDLRQALCGSGQVHARCLDPVTLQPRTELAAPPSNIKQWLRRSALAQYLVSQLKVSPERLWRLALASSRPPGHAAARAPSVQPVAAPNLALVNAVAAAFFDRVAPYVKGQLVIVVDRNRSRAARDQAFDDPERARFIALARQAGARIVDAEPLQQRHHAQSALSLEVGPYDRHFNALGIGMLMDAAAQALPGTAP
ncbi:hypothetical protein [Azohydromonas aeria]|uniref:hypothetical protein n=1 Tax=Azohydromonas aeria TaxID=2590212 RepID=UPI0012F85220|nr:hypothetical protein [Azohydromonas aeria]